VLLNRCICSRQKSTEKPKTLLEDRRLSIESGGYADMNLLIVDDEVIAINAIMNTIDWDMLPLDQILTANSFQQAVQVFAEKPVDIVLCDIEMPQGNGLELIEWINRFYPLTIKYFIKLP
jgi:CheY-like chemotaxis protein